MKPSSGIEHGHDFGRGDNRDEPLLQILNRHRTIEPSAAPRSDDTNRNAFPATAMIALGRFSR